MERVKVLSRIATCVLALALPSAALAAQDESPAASPSAAAAAPEVKAPEAPAPEVKAPDVKVVETLITPAEAKLPVDPTAQPARGITRGPTVHLEAGAPHAGKPFDFRINVTPHGGATIDPADIHVTYMKVPAVDLTDRLKPYRTADGIEMHAAEAPVGDHPLKVDVQDSEGHVTSAIVHFDVAP